MTPPQISVVIPAFNEVSNFKAGKLDEVYRYLQSTRKSFELLLVDDGSTDETLSLLKKFAENKKEVKVLPLLHQGKALTVKEGMIQASGSMRLFTDFDQSTPISEVEKLIPFIGRGYDVVIGSREVKGSRRDNEPWFRHIMGKGFNTIVKILAVRGIQDTQCGFKLFTDKAVTTLFKKLKVTTTARKEAFTGAFDVELMYVAQREKFMIAEVPVLWSHVTSQRVSPARDSWRMFVEVAKIRLASWRGVYEA